MEVQYEPRLTETVLLLEAERRLQRGDRRLMDEYHRLADPLYERFSPEHREAAFAKLHQALFLKLGFGRPLLEALEEFRGAFEGVKEVLVGSATSAREEGADLSRDLTALALRFKAERLLEPDLPQRLRHELMHVADMRDGAFGYREEGRLSPIPAEENLIRDRYRVLWDLSISWRLTQEGKKPLFSRDALEEEFERLFGNLPAGGMAALFGLVWGGGKMTHEVLLRMAKDPSGFLAARPGHPEEGGKGSSVSRGQRPLPGSPCPLCRFPTFDWVQGPGELDGALLQAIRRDFPTWRPEAGACQRCVELYRLRGCEVGQEAARV